MNYAIVDAGGKQYKVSKGSVVFVDSLQGDNKEVVLDKVLLYVNETDVQVGAPYLSNINIKATLLEHAKGEKIKVSHFKAKSNYRRTVGFRAHYSKITIEDIIEKSAKEISKKIENKEPKKTKE